MSSYNESDPPSHEKFPKIDDNKIEKIAVERHPDDIMANDDHAPYHSTLGYPGQREFGYDLGYFPVHHQGEALLSTTLGVLLEDPGHVESSGSEETEPKEDQEFFISKQSMFLDAPFLQDGVTQHEIEQSSFSIGDPQDTSLTTEDVAKCQRRYFIKVDGYCTCESYDKNELVRFLRAKNYLLITLAQSETGEAIEQIADLNVHLRSENAQQLLAEHRSPGYIKLFDEFVLIRSYKDVAEMSSDPRKKLQNRLAFQETFVYYYGVVVFWGVTSFDEKLEFMRKISHLEIEPNNIVFKETSSNYTFKMDYDYKDELLKSTSLLSDLGGSSHDIDRTSDSSSASLLRDSASLLPANAAGRLNSPNPLDSSQESSTKTDRTSLFQSSEDEDDDDDDDDNDDDEEEEEEEHEHVEQDDNNFEVAHRYHDDIEYTSLDVRPPSSKRAKRRKQSRANGIMSTLRQGTIEFVANVFRQARQFGIRGISSNRLGSIQHSRGESQYSETSIESDQLLLHPSESGGIFLQTAINPQRSWIELSAVLCHYNLSHEFSDKIHVDLLMSDVYDSAAPQAYYTGIDLHDEDSPLHYSIKDDIISILDCTERSRLIITSIFSQTIKLNVWEKKIGYFVKKYLFIPKSLQMYGEIKQRMEKSYISMAIGELYSVLTDIYLSGTILNKPSFLWNDKDTYISFYHRFKRYMKIDRRIINVESRLDILTDIIGFLNDFIQTQYGTYLTHIVIILLFIDIFVVAIEMFMEFSVV